MATQLMCGGQSGRVDTRTPREYEVLELRVQGHSNRAVAALLLGPDEWLVLSRTDGTALADRAVTRPPGSRSG
ncbi:hypothetical protein [Streptomyces sp. NPDC056061]|uniref:hypothetical protein n=1 Tax=Streptomyces sp. NPDC056061 TaxID=3345700 RepID=UPI0035DD679F